MSVNERTAAMSRKTLNPQSATGVLCLLLMATALGCSRSPSATVFLDVCKSGTPEQVTAAINAGADVNAKDPKGQTPLFEAAKMNPNPGVIAALIKAGADVN